MKLSSIMVVDDSDADQLISKIIIEEYDPNINILQAYDGQEALEILERIPHKPNLIFLDINMPRMNGHIFLETYNTLINEKSTVVVMLTSSTQDEDRKRSMAYECVKEYLVKPLEANHIETLKQLQPA